MKSGGEREREREKTTTTFRATTDSFTPTFPLVKHALYYYSPFVVHTQTHIHIVLRERKEYRVRGDPLVVNPSAAREPT